MTTIKSIVGRELLDATGIPMLEVDVLLECGVLGRAAVAQPDGDDPAWFQLRDGDPARYGGQGLGMAVSTIGNHIMPELKGLDVLDQHRLDQELKNMDGTPDYRSIGANTVQAVSFAAAQAAALALDLPLFRYLGGVQTVTLPLPCFAMAGSPSGAHISLTPREMHRFREALRTGAEIHRHLGEEARNRGWGQAVNERGAWMADATAEEWLDALMFAVEKSGRHPESDVEIVVEGAALPPEVAARYPLAALNDYDRLHPTGHGTLGEVMARAEASARPLMLCDCRGGSDDTFEADLAVAVHARRLMAGAPCRHEHMAKYNQLLRIENLLDGVARLA